MTTARPDRTALIVDDEDQLLRLMSRVLEKAGIRTLTATTAAEARRLFQEHERELDLLLLDVTLPDGEGAEQLLPEFAARRADARVIVTSGDEPPPALAADLERLGGDFLRKPFVPAELLRLADAPTRKGAPRAAPAPTAGPA